MPSWRIDVSISINLDSDDIDNWEVFRSNRGGPRADLLTERQFLDGFCGLDFADLALQFDLLRRPEGVNSQWVIDGATVKSGADGRFRNPAEFQTPAGGLVGADVGRIIRVPAGQLGNNKIAEGHYKIIAVIDANTATIDGVIPVVATNFDFDINEPTQELLATLLSTA